MGQTHKGVQVHIETAHLHINEALQDLNNAQLHISSIIVSNQPDIEDICDDLAALNRILAGVGSLLDAKQHDIAIAARPDPL